VERQYKKNPTTLREQNKVSFVGRVVDVETAYYDLTWTDHSHRSGVRNRRLDVGAVTQGADYFKFCVATRSPSSATFFFFAKMSNKVKQAVDLLNK